MTCEKSIIKALFLFSFVLFSSFPVQAKKTTDNYIGASNGSTITVVDGDGLKIGDLRIRLWGIDAPELKQECTLNQKKYSCGEDARFLLGALVMGGEVRCLIKNTDRYNRTECINGRGSGISFAASWPCHAVNPPFCSCLGFKSTTMWENEWQGQRNRLRRVMALPCREPTSFYLSRVQINNIAGK